SFGAAYVVGYFDDVPAMERVYDRHRGASALVVEGGQFRLREAAAQPGGTSHVTVLTADGKDKRVVYSAPRKLEAPNSWPDGKYLVLNGEGKLWRLPLAGGEPEVVDTGKVTGINNDHGISPDGKRYAISAGHIYVLPSAGGAPRQVTKQAPSYYHGWSPD